MQAERSVSINGVVDEGEYCARARRETDVAVVEYTVCDFCRYACGDIHCGTASIPHTEPAQRRIASKGHHRSASSVGNQGVKGPITPYEDKAVFEDDVFEVEPGQDDDGVAPAD